MKKKLLIITSIVTLIVASIILIIFLNQTKYTIKVSKVDDQSPDRILTVYKEEEKIEVKRIELLDGRLLCSGFNTTVHFGNIEGISKLKVILNDNKEVIAKIVIEEVK